MPDFVRQGAPVKRSVVDAAAGQLRKLSDAEDREPEADKPAPKAKAAAKPKAAKRVPARES